MPIWAEAWSNNGLLGQVMGSPKVTEPLFCTGRGKGRFLFMDFPKVREKTSEKMAGHVLELSEEQLNELVTMGKFKEI